MSNQTWSNGDLVAFYVDRGWSEGLRAAMQHWLAVGMAFETRRLTEDLRGAIERVPALGSCSSS